jgi:SAM-dependent methyltransferase
MHTDVRKYNRWPLLTKLAINWKLYRLYKTLRGLVRTYILPGKYSRKIDHDWWEAFYTTHEISDAHTVEPGKAPYPSLVHYKGVESIILGQFYNRGFTIEGKTVLDIGSGSGHWITFYRQLGARSVDGVEISSVAATALVDKYKNAPDIRIHNLPAEQLRSSLKFDIINAIGVMFHIVEDEEFELTVGHLKEMLKPGGYLVVGGQFGCLDNLNVQFDAQGRVNKRLRSRGHWRRLLLGFESVQVHKNTCYKLVNATLPENNILIARNSHRRPDRTQLGKDKFV